MKNIKLALLLTTFLCCLQPLTAQNLFTDDFNYPVRDSLEGLGGWDRTGLNSPNNIKVSAPGLTYSGYPGSNIGNTVSISNNYSGDVCLNNFTTQTSGSVYMAFMIKVDSLTARATRGYNIGFDQSGGPTNFNTLLFIRKVSSNTFNFGIEKFDSLPVYDNTVYQTNTTYLVALKYTFVAGSANDSSKLFVFSSGIPTTEPQPNVFEVAGGDIPDIGQVFLSCGYAQDSALAGSSVKIDGIRISTNWTGAVLTNLNVISTEAPIKFNLNQNFPNPFNPSTQINFDIPNAGHVKLIIYDIIGKEVATLVDENLTAGSYKTDWNASAISSGVYFYRITAGDYVSTKKMILIK